LKEKSSNQSGITSPFNVSRRGERFQVIDQVIDQVRLRAFLSLAAPEVPPIMLCCARVPVVDFVRFAGDGRPFAPSALKPRELYFRSGSPYARRIAR
jgi:hypothetical protein